MAVGACAILFAYLGASRQVLAAKQIPYFISGGITGMVLVGVGAFFLKTEELRRELGRLDRVEQQIAELHAALLRPAGNLVANTDPGYGSNSPTPSPSRPAAARKSGSPERERATLPSTAVAQSLVAIPGGSKYHRPDCPMVRGKEAAGPVSASAAARRGLSSCSLCEPVPLET